MYLCKALRYVIIFHLVFFVALLGATEFDINTTKVSSTLQLKLFNTSGELIQTIPLGTRDIGESGILEIPDSELQEMLSGISTTDVFYEVFGDGESISPRRELDSSLLIASTSDASILSDDGSPEETGEILDALAVGLELGNGTESVIVLDNSLFGIGLPTGVDPSAKLYVNAPTYPTASVVINRFTAGGVPSIMSGTSNPWLMLDGNLTANGNVGLNYYSTGDVILSNAGGNVGIGTSTPATKLHIFNTASTGGGAYNPIVDVAIEDNQYAYIEFKSDLYSGITFNDNATSIYAGMFYHSLIDHITFKTGGTADQMTIASTGDVGIGIGSASPTSKLEVNSSASSTAVSGYYNTTSYGQLGKNSQTGVYGTSPIWAGYFVGDLYTSGDIGVGTIIPNDKLDVVGVIDATTGYQQGNSAPSGRYLRGNGSAFVSATIQASDLPAITSAGGWTDDGANVRLTTSGDNVGIGTASPIGKLHINNATSSSGTLYGVNVNNTGSNTATAYGVRAYSGVYSGGGTGGTYYGVHGKAEYGTNSYGVYGEGAYATTNTYGVYGTITSTGGTGYAIYGNQGSGNWAGYFVGDGYFSGDVGIGTTSPSAKLDVVGVLELSGTTPTDPGSDIVRLGDSGTSLRVQTNHGYVDVGPANTSWCHFTTDRTSFYFSPQVTVNGDVEPYTDNAFDLGSSTREWRNLYVDGTAYLDGLTMGGNINMNGYYIYNVDNIRFQAESNYIIRVENDNDSGIYYNYSSNLWEWRLNGAQRGYIDLDNGNMQIDGAFDVRGNIFDGGGDLYLNDIVRMQSTTHQYGDFYMGSYAGDANDMYISDRIVDWDDNSYYWDAASISRNNEINFDVGSVIDPSVYFGDDNTGFYAPGAGYLGVTINGTEAIRVNTSRNVGIGTTGPTQRLDVNGNVTANVYYDRSSTTYFLDPGNSGTSGRFGGNLQIGYASSTDDDYLYFDQNSEYLRWDNSPGEFDLSDDLNVLGYLKVGTCTNAYCETVTQGFESNTTNTGNWAGYCSPWNRVGTRSCGGCTITPTGSYQLRSCDIGNNQYTRGRMTFSFCSGGGSISYQICSSSESGWDYMGVRHDADCMPRTSGAYNYRTSGCSCIGPYTYSFTTSGSHYISFCYQKDGSASSYCDEGYLDDVVATNVSQTLTLTTGDVFACNRVIAGSGYLGDVAEYVLFSDEVTAGDLVSVDPYQANTYCKSRSNYDRMLIGIVSENPTLIANNPSEGSPLALTGRVHAKVSTSNGSIAIGDYITSSTVPGIGMKATEDGAVVAIALEALADGEGKILVQIAPGWFAGGKSNSQEGTIITIENGVYQSKSGVLEGKSTFVPFNDIFKSRADFSKEISVVVSPKGQWAPLFVGEITPEGFTIRRADDADGDVEFSFSAYGTLIPDAFDESGIYIPSEYENNSNEPKACDSSELDGEELVEMYRQALADKDYTGELGLIELNMKIQWAEALRDGDFETAHEIRRRIFGLNGIDLPEENGTNDSLQN